MGCPDAVRAELINLPGLMGVHYLPEQDIFLIKFWSDRIGLPQMFAAIWAAGRKQGRDFLPEQVE